MSHQAEALDQAGAAATVPNPVTPRGQRPGGRADRVIASQAEDGACGAPGSSCDGGAPSFVYAIATGIEARFRDLAAEKEFAQAMGPVDTAGKTDQQTFHAVLSEREHRYLLRQLCWVLTIR